MCLAKTGGLTLLLRHSMRYGSGMTPFFVPTVMKDLVLGFKVHNSGNWLFKLSFFMRIILKGFKTSSTNCKP